ncbi:MAG: hypothetical protein AAGH83_10455 [Pseudomonadota bacterium]
MTMDGANLRAAYSVIKVDLSDASLGNATLSIDPFIGTDADS